MITAKELLKLAKDTEIHKISPENFILFLERMVEIEKWNEAQKLIIVGNWKDLLEALAETMATQLDRYRCFFGTELEDLFYESGDTLVEWRKFKKSV